MNGKLKKGFVVPLCIVAGGLAIIYYFATSIPPFSNSLTRTKIDRLYKASVHVPANFTYRDTKGSGDGLDSSPSEVYEYTLTGDLHAGMVKLEQSLQADGYQLEDASVSYFDPRLDNGFIVRNPKNGLHLDVTVFGSNASEMDIEALL